MRGLGGENGAMIRVVLEARVLLTLIKYSQTTSVYQLLTVK